MRIGMALIAALALAGCEDGAPEQGRIEMRAANPVSDELKALPVLYRYLGLRRGIVDTGGRCKRVERGSYQQEHKNMSMWAAHCVDSGDWAIFIAPGGDVQARKCSDAKILGIPECRPITGPPAPPVGQPAPSKKAAP